MKDHFKTGFEGSRAKIEKCCLAMWMQAWIDVRCQMLHCDSGSDLSNSELVDNFADVEVCCVSVFQVFVAPHKPLANRAASRGRSRTKTGRIPHTKELFGCKPVRCVLHPH